MNRKNSLDQNRPVKYYWWSPYLDRPRHKYFNSQGRGANGKLVTFHSVSDSIDDFNHPGYKEYLVFMGKNRYGNSYFLTLQQNWQLVYVGHLVGIKYGRNEENA